MNKKTIIRTLEKIALYMELQGENPFKVSAFRKAAAALEGDERSLSEMDDVTKLKGIGKGTAAVIEDLMATGESSLLKELEEVVPKGLLPLLKLPGLGGKKIAKLHQELGIDSAESLKAACEAGKVRELAGFAVKTEEKILKELANLANRSERLPIWQLEPVVLQIEALLGSMKEVDRFSVAGSFRRALETSKDIDFIVVTEAVEEVRETLLNSLAIQEVVAAGDTKISVILDLDEPVSVDFRLVKDNEYATALHHFTGSKDHNVRMRQIAKARGEKISEYGVEQEDGSVLTFQDEAAFFAHFDLPWIPPSLRTGTAEFDKTNIIQNLVRLEDIKADLHMHTTWSDGAYSVAEMGEALLARGYQYSVITDHSQFLKVANGLTPERLEKQRVEIEAFNAAHPDFHLFKGTEMDILPDGSLDFEDQVLKELDFVIASIHSSFTQSQDKIMARLLTAMQNPYVHMIAHPTGRIIEDRDGYNPDMKQLIAWAKEYGKILELNANPYRLDLCVEHLEMACAAGVPVAINTDAHDIAHLRFMDIGVRYANRAWLPKDMIVNTWTREQFEAFIQRNK
ncbi:DNA polymerase/3'-5' exonuclease PolX [Lysinibacillus sp. OL1_EC]|uniref:DNA polymerase/3'-5' exonuclease PolX n=1 Tax=unclassified Lysinibacillus TaxID=2636778 RepID=UPI00103BE5CC|nr:MULTISPECIES: DNA polymerase/3'-5' exonuclease PolX [unclassified Lysinibacillus]MCM0625375.1 DNA polymerase/3'-5' exonuclease PolX [Lysinibacillus sp. OL1_EC]MCS5500952.1 DNA polymerase/3'-5' exonuclease PolX [Lysinibacillus sp. A4]TBV87098.1 DNA polymerase/3'-5' exonuclease PolX [Lysinibacillus sp. OL1]UKJ44356.1 DNA polymerase/3'-5' exonuclease PolX [Lysinibacillus sp. ACHW1.5]WGT41346.1 DNA polymerase/3'-5' exonuclease PolX [Lysinibacillus sp. 1 U-2021]